MKGTDATPLLVLCSDDALRESLMELLVADGRPVTAEPAAEAEQHPAILAVCDAWPAGWNLARLRSTFRGVPCLVLSGSPLGGDFVVAQLRRGYFVQLPVLPGDILGLVAELFDA